MGLLLGSLMNPMAAGIVDRQRSETGRQLADIREALIGYAAVQHRLPCPVVVGASAAQQVTDVCDNAHGYVPAAVLGITGRYDINGLLTDSWGSPIQYHVSLSDSDNDGYADFTTAGEMRDVGMQNLSPEFEVCDGASCAQLRANRIPAVLVSTGKTQSGSTDETENQNLDNRFVSRDMDTVGTDQFDNHKFSYFLDNCFRLRELCRLETGLVISRCSLTLTVSTEVGSMKKKQQGFTLIEIAIVLLIIGLLLGGIMKGQSMINSARVRAIANDLTGIEAAWISFQDRYRGLPGDYARASTHIVQGAIDGDANARVDSGAEAGAVWQHLAGAGFISGNFDGAAIASLTDGACTAATCPGEVMYELDLKMDDGVPGTGRLRSFDAAPYNSCVANGEWDVVNGVADCAGVLELPL